MNAIEVIYKNEVIGACVFNPEDNKIYFNYTNNFINKGIELSPFITKVNSTIYESDPRSSIKTFKNLIPMLADSLPDDFGNFLYKQWLNTNKKIISDINPIERLSFLGNRGMGALEYKPILEIGNEDIRDIKIKDLLNIAKNILNDKQHEKEYLDNEKVHLDTLLRIGSSAGGARPKAVIAINDNTGEIKAGDVIQNDDFDYYLIKFDGLDKHKNIIEPKGYMIIEYVYHLMAKKLNIQMTDSKLFEENKRKHFLTKRFDRDKGGIKHHIQTVCGLTGLDFNIKNVMSYEDLLRMTLQLTSDNSQVEQMYKRMVFNVVALNRDDHIKNFSFMLKDKSWNLTPAYDLTYSFKENHEFLMEHAISVNGKNENIQLDDLFDVADIFSIKNAEKIVYNTLDVVSKFQNFAKKHGAHNDKIEVISYYLEKNIKNIQSNRKGLKL